MKHIMKIHYPNTNIQFTLEHNTISVQNIIFERLTRTIPTHSHGSNCYEIHYISSGYGKLKTKEANYDICPNTLYVTGPHVEHAQSPLISDPMEEYCIYLKLHSTAAACPSSPVLSAFREVPFWFGQDTQQILGSLQQIFQELEHQYTGYRTQVESLLSQLIIYLVRNYENGKSVSHKNHISQQADKNSILIEEYFLYEYQSLSLETLSSRLNLSTRQTQRLMQEYYGKTFQQKKAEARMSAAAILLEEEGQSITSIANLLGYSSVEHFSSAFHQYYKMSPRDYRKQGTKYMKSPTESTT